jgi:ribonuclease HII
VALGAALGRRDRPPEHLPRDASRHAPRDRRLGGHDHVLVDGNRIAQFEQQVGPYTAIVDGDAKCYTIACASVVAKVVRDRMMTLLAARYPGYGWEHNQGYATQAHRDGIRALGLTPFHRRSFLALAADARRRPAAPRPVRGGRFGAGRVGGSR